MKLILIAFSLVASAALAADEPKCPYMPCGEYEGKGSWYDVNGKAEKDGQYDEKIIISPVDEKTVNIKVYIYRGTPGKPWTDSNIIFKENGEFSLVHDGVSHAAGFCAHQVCTVSFAPVDVDDQGKKFVNSFTDILRFDGGNLKRYNMVADSANDNELMFQRSDLKKK